MGRGARQREPVHKLRYLRADNVCGGAVPSVVSTGTLATLALAEISWLLPNGPELAAPAVRILASAETNDAHRRVLAELSLASQSRFPEKVTVAGRDSVGLEG
jgi:hypothetical protein